MCYLHKTNLKESVTFSDVTFQRGSTSVETSQKWMGLDGVGEKVIGLSGVRLHLFV